MRVRALMVPPGMPDFFSRRRIADAGPVEIDRPCLVGRSPRHPRGSRRRWRLVGRPARRIGGRVRVARLALHLAGTARASTPSRAAPRMPRATFSRSSSRGTRRAWATTRSRPVSVTVACDRPLAVPTRTGSSSRRFATLRRPRSSHTSANGTRTTRFIARSSSGWRSLASWARRSPRNTAGRDSTTSAWASCARSSSAPTRPSAWS